MNKTRRATHAIQVQVNAEVASRWSSDLAASVSIVLTSGLIQRQRLEVSASSGGVDFATSTSPLCRLRRLMCLIAVILSSWHWILLRTFLVGWWLQLLVSFDDGLVLKAPALQGLWRLGVIIFNNRLGQVCLQ